ncbi:MAG: T9SS type A sorting domain-containing protein [Duncaniella sp.]|nr:T9SS type A sorting domain-containing protein [Duncaniella sp.]
MKKLLLQRLALIAMLLCMAVPRGSAEDAASDTGTTVYHLIVVHKDGSQVKVPFAHLPEFRHDGTALQLTSSELDMTYPAGTLDHFRIEAEKVDDQGGSTGISRPAADTAATPGHNFVAGAIEITGALPGSEATLYNLDGRLVSRTTVEADGSAIIPFADLAPGIYVIKTSNSTFKAIKK